MNKKYTIIILCILVILASYVVVVQKDTPMNIQNNTIDCEDDLVDQKITEGDSSSTSGISADSDEVIPSSAASNIIESQNVPSNPYDTTNSTL